MCTDKQFFNDVEKGKFAEEQFEKLSKCLGINVDDVRMDKDFMAIDVDYLCWKNDVNNKTKVEIKLDSAFGNYKPDKQRFFIEDISTVSINSDGWYRYCKSDILFVYDYINSMFYAFKMCDLREYINYYFIDRDNRCNRVIDVFITKDNGQSSRGYGVYIQLFYKWLNDGNRFNKTYCMSKYVD